MLSLEQLIHVVVCKRAKRDPRTSSVDPALWISVFKDLLHEFSDEIFEFLGKGAAEDMSPRQRGFEKVVRALKVRSDKSFDELLADSSLGTEGVQSLAARTSSETTRRILDRSDELAYEEELKRAQRDKDVPKYVFAYGKKFKQITIVRPHERDSALKVAAHYRIGDLTDISLTVRVCNVGLTFEVEFQWGDDNRRFNGEVLHKVIQDLLILEDKTLRPLIVGDEPDRPDRRRVGPQGPFREPVDADSSVQRFVERVQSNEEWAEQASQPHLTERARESLLWERVTEARIEEALATYLATESVDTPREAMKQALQAALGLPPIPLKRRFKLEGSHKTFPAPFDAPFILEDVEVARASVACNEVSGQRPIAMQAMRRAIETLFKPEVDPDGTSERELMFRVALIGRHLIDALDEVWGEQEGALVDINVEQPYDYVLVLENLIEQLSDCRTDRDAEREPADVFFEQLRHVYDLGRNCEQQFDKSVEKLVLGFALGRFQQAGGTVEDMVRFVSEWSHKPVPGSEDGKD